MRSSAIAWRYWEYKVIFIFECNGTMVRYSNLDEKVDSFDLGNNQIKQ